MRSTAGLQPRRHWSSQVLRFSKGNVSDREERQAATSSNDARWCRCRNTLRSRQSSDPDISTSTYGQAAIFRSHLSRNSTSSIPVPANIHYSSTTFDCVARSSRVFLVIAWPPPTTKSSEALSHGSAGGGHIHHARASGLAHVALPMRHHTKHNRYYRNCTGRQASSEFDTVTEVCSLYS